MSGRWVGGHEFVFKYIPSGQVWVSDQVPVGERNKIIQHEVTERALMEKGMPYNLAHIEALKSEGNITEAEIQKRSYITPQETRMQFGRIYPIGEKENTWKLDNKVISFDELAGIIYVHEGDKIIDQLLVRSTEDINKFVEKHRTGKNPTVV